MCVSIIVPVYNSERYIARCIESILNQSFKKFELILINDGSQDKSGEICDYYKKMDKRISVIHLKNKGVSNARNIGVENSKMKYIMFIDSDDYIHSKTLEIIVGIANKYKSDLTMFSYKSVDKYYSDLTQTSIEDLRIKKINNLEILKESYRTERTEYLAVWNKLISRKLLQKIKFPIEIQYGEDHYVSNLLYYNARSIYIIENELYFYFIKNSNSITKSNIILNIEQYLGGYKKEYEYFKKNRNNLIQGYVLERILNSAIHLRYIGNKINNLELTENIQNELSIYFKEIKNLKDISFIKKLKIYLFIKFKFLYVLKLSLYKVYVTRVKSKF